MTTLITGIAGQDGYYMAREMNDVVGLYHGQDEHRLESLKAELPWVTFERGDIRDSSSMDAIVQRWKPDYVFNLAACSYVGSSWEMPRLYMETNYGGFLNILEACRKFAPGAHIVQASTSEMFGNVGGLLNEDSPMVPASPYGVSKLAAHRLCNVYRESYGMHVSSAISFNHESPRRPARFVTRKVTKAMAEKQPVLELGNLNATRDWGFAGDYMDAYRLMALAEKPDDYVVATGVSHSIADLVETAARYAGATDYEVRSTAENLRPNDLVHLVGDASKIRSELGWMPSVSFERLIGMMVAEDMNVPAEYAL